MIRILHVVSSLNINAGMMSVIMNYYRHINRDKVQFDFLYFEEKSENHLSEIIELGGRTFFISYPTFKPSDQNKLHEFFEAHRGEFTAVHCHPIWASEVVGIEAKKSGIKHVIQHSHSTKFAETKKSEIRNRFLMKFIGFFATEFIACSPEASYLFGKKRVEEGKVRLLPNAIGLEQYKFSPEGRKKIREEFDASDDMIIVGNVGRLSPQKNQLFILEIFDEFRKLVPHSKLLIVGEGILRNDIERKIEMLELTKDVVLTGKRRDIQDILSGMDIFLMPSVFEGSPVSAVEALTAGLPCILSDSITKSVDIDGVMYYSIKRAPHEWAKETLTFYNQRKNHDRFDFEDVIRHGFDITEEAYKLQSYYEKLV